MENLGKPDRKIEKLYAWISIDPATNLQGVAAIKIGDLNVQSVSSSIDTIMKMKPEMERVCAEHGYHFELVQFNPAKVIYKVY